MNTALLSDVTPGFAQPVQGAQSVFRHLLEATARPGRAMTLDAGALAGLQASAPMGRGMAALLLTLLDAETTLQLGGALATPRSSAFYRFHTGVTLVERPRDAAFLAWRHDEVLPTLWRALDSGSDESPQAGATLLVEVASLVCDPAWPHTEAPGHAVCLRLRGPGIETLQRLQVGGPGREFWRERIAMQPLFPRGVDLVLCCNEQLAAIPRSTLIELED